MDEKCREYTYFKYHGVALVGDIDDSQDCLNKYSSVGEYHYYCVGNKFTDRFRMFFDTLFNVKFPVIREKDQ